MEYHSITNSQIVTFQTVHTNNQEIQNAKVIFSCIEPSIKEDVKDTIFTQCRNLPMHEDGVVLFKKLATFTTVLFLQLSMLSMLSFNKILNFNPFDCQFNIPTTSSKLILFLVLATISTQILLNIELIQHTLNVYYKISQPET